MPDVTGTLSDIGLVPFPGLTPVLIFAPPRVAAATSGRIFPTKDVEHAVTSASGAFTVPLATTDNVIGPEPWWTLSIGWRDPNGYQAGEGYSKHDETTWKVRVPAGGGRLVDMLDVPLARDVTAVGLLSQRIAEDLHARGVGYVFDLSGTPALYALEAS